MKNYHAHVYFDQDQLSKAQAIFAQANLEASPDLFKVWKIYFCKVGPHQLPMFELHFNESSRSKAIEWLKKNVGELSVLIHQDSGNDFKDHHEAQWLGTKLSIDYTFFELVKADPTKAIHPTIT